MRSLGRGFRPFKLRKGFYCLILADGSHPGSVRISFSEGRYDVIKRNVFVELQYCDAFA